MFNRSELDSLQQQITFLTKQIDRHTDKIYALERKIELLEDHNKHQTVLISNATAEKYRMIGSWRDTFTTMNVRDALGLVINYLGLKYDNPPATLVKDDG